MTKTKFIEGLQIDLTERCTFCGGLFLQAIGKKIDNSKKAWFVIECTNCKEQYNKAYESIELLKVDYTPIEQQFNYVHDNTTKSFFSRVINKLKK